MVSYDTFTFDGPNYGGIRYVMIDPNHTYKEVYVTIYTDHYVYWKVPYDKRLLFLTDGTPIPDVLRLLYSVCSPGQKATLTRWLGYRPDQV